MHTNSKPTTNCAPKKTSPGLPPPLRKWVDVKLCAGVPHQPLRYTPRQVGRATTGSAIPLHSSGTAPPPSVSLTRGEQCFYCTYRIFKLNVLCVIIYFGSDTHCIWSCLFHIRTSIYFFTCARTLSCFAYSYRRNKSFSFELAYFFMPEITVSSSMRERLLSMSQIVRSGL